MVVVFIWAPCSMCLGLFKLQDVPSRTASKRECKAPEIRQAQRKARDPHHESKPCRENYPEAWRRCALPVALPTGYISGLHDKSLKAIGFWNPQAAIKAHSHKS